MDPDKTELGRRPLIVRSPPLRKGLGCFRLHRASSANDPNAPLMTVRRPGPVCGFTANVQEKDIHYVHDGDPRVCKVCCLPQRKHFAEKVLFVAGRSGPRHTHRKSAWWLLTMKTGVSALPCSPPVVLKTWDTKELTVPTSALVMGGRSHNSLRAGRHKTPLTRGPFKTSEQAGRQDNH